MLRVSLFLTFCLVGCATDAPSAPLAADTVNASLEERIDQRVKDGTTRGFPDLASIRTEPPSTTSVPERRVQQNQLTTAAAALQQELQSDLMDARNDQTVQEKAAALKAAIERDRAAAEAEGSLRPTPPPEDN